MPKTYEYEEGKQARKNFEKGMRALFQIPKDAVPAKKKARKKRVKKTTERDVSRDSERPATAILKLTTKY